MARSLHAGANILVYDHSRLVNLYQWEFMAQEHVGPSCCVGFFSSFSIDLSPERMAMLLSDCSRYCRYPSEMISKPAFHVYTSDLHLANLQSRMWKEVILSLTEPTQLSS